MLLKSAITNIAIHSDDWFAGRLAKITSSEFHFLMGEKGIGSTGENYIYRKVGEELTGIPCRKEITTDATEHGHLYEPDNIRLFGQRMGLDFLVTQKLIVPEGRREGSTPDAIWIISESGNELSYNVSTVEAKCPTAYDNYIRLWNCKTPEQVKAVNKIYYWQVLHQMRTCDCLKGYLSIYNPFFKVGNLNIVEFKKIDLVSEFKLMNSRVIEAEAIFVQQRDKMLAA